jgi:rod shape-determining protein MreD
MSFTGPLVPRQRTSPRDERWSKVFLGFLTVAAVVFQVTVPLLSSYLAYVELPLLFAIHFAVARRSPMGALLYGAAVGLLQDTFSSRPLGLYGIVKTLIGFFAANAALRMDADNAAVRVLLSFVFYILHQLFQLVLTQALLGEVSQFDLVGTAVSALLNAMVAVPLFQLLDRL